MENIKMWKKKTQQYYLASKFEKFLFTLGVPSKYWVEREKFPFKDILKEYKSKGEDKVQRVAAQSQKDFFSSCFKSVDILLAPRIVGVSSSPTDDVALHVAFSIIKKAASYVMAGRHNFDIRVLNLAEIESVKLRASPDILLIYNITPDSTRGRIQTARDLLQLYNTSFRILVIAGVDPVTFFKEKLRMELTDALYVKTGLLKVRRL